MTRLHITHEQSFALNFEEISENYQGNSFRSVYIDLLPEQLEKIQTFFQKSVSFDNPYLNLWMTHAKTGQDLYLIFSYCFGVERDAILDTHRQQITSYNPHNILKTKNYPSIVYFYENEKPHSQRLIFKISLASVD